MQEPYDKQSASTIEKTVAAFGGSEAARAMVMVVYSLGVMDGMLKFSEATNERMVSQL